jgi:hypothetical protein
MPRSNRRPLGGVEEEMAAGGAGVRRRWPPSAARRFGPRRQVARLASRLQESRPSRYVGAGEGGEWDSVWEEGSGMGL